MSLFTTTLLVLAAGLLPSQLLSAISPQWFGTWTLDRGRSHLVGPSITIARIPHGYHFNFGATSFDIGDDGAFYPTVPTRTTSIKQTGEREWFRVHKTNGKEVDHGTLRVTADEKSLLIHTVSTDPDGSVHESDEAEVRVGTGTGLAGTWRSTLAGANVSKVFRLTDAGEGRIRFDYPKAGQFYVALPGGSPAQYEGPQSVPGITVSLRAVSPVEMRWTERINGKDFTEGIDRLSEVGKVLTETTWPVAQPGDRQVAVYGRKSTSAEGGSSSLRDRTR